MKSRVMRDIGKHSGKSIVFVSSSVKTEFYLASSSKVEAIDFLEAVKYLRAKPEEQPVPFTNDMTHYNHVNEALQKFTTEYIEIADTSSISVTRKDLDRTSLEANSFLRTIKQVSDDDRLISYCDTLTQYINEGIYQKLPRRIKELSRKYKNDRAKVKLAQYDILQDIEALCNEYNTMNSSQRHDAQDVSNPLVIISETFA